MRPFLFWLKALALASILSQSQAFFQAGSKARADTETRRSRLALQLGMGILESPTGEESFITSPLFSGSFLISKNSHLVAEWGLSLSSALQPKDGEESFYAAIGNPLIGLAYQLGEGLVISPALTIPIASLPEGRRRQSRAESAFFGAMGSRGLRDHWLFLPDRFSMIGAISFIKWFSPILVESHFKLAYSMSILREKPSLLSNRQRSSKGANTFTLQLELRLSTPIYDPLWLALDSAIVYLPNHDDEAWNFSLMPELRVALGEASHLSLGFNLNLNEPWGPSWRPGHEWTVLLGVSSEL